MAINTVRYRRGDVVGFGVVRGDGIVPVPGDFATTGDFILRGAERARALAGAPAVHPLGDVEVLCPITSNQQLVCQGMNYRSHLAEIGQDPRRQTFNMFFRKASSSLSAASADIVRPPHVRLLDYEIELALVVGRAIDGPLDVTAERLPELVAAVAILNDVSARDVQIPQSQFYKGKSYRSFAPTGPWLTLLDREDFACLGDLELSLAVNGETRQHGRVADLLFGPAATLTELSGLQDFAPGDVIATGTPGGVALAIPGAASRWVANLLPEPLRWKLFVRSQERSARYLRPGDVVTSRIRTPDGRLDLGEQRNRVVAAPAANAPPRA
ncbi:MAG: fumarylacetoacetate hydrolase family protein [bacterium]